MGLTNAVLASRSAQLVSRRDAVVFAVRCDDKATFVVSVAFPGNRPPETIYDGVRFTARYYASSLVVDGALTYTFTIVRQSGWPGSPSFIADGAAFLTPPGPGWADTWGDVWPSP